MPPPPFREGVEAPSPTTVSLQRLRKTLATPLPVISTYQSHLSLDAIEEDCIIQKFLKRLTPNTQPERSESPTSPPRRRPPDSSGSNSKDNDREGDPPPAPPSPSLAEVEATGGTHAGRRITYNARTAAVKIQASYRGFSARSHYKPSPASAGGDGGGRAGGGGDGGGGGSPTAGLQLGELLGVGSFGRVYRALDSEGKEVAVKQMLLQGDLAVFQVGCARRVPAE